MAKTKNSFDKLLERLTKGLQELCDQLIEVVKIENGEITVPTTNVKSWKKDGNILTHITNGNGEVSVATVLELEKTRNYIASQLGNVKFVPYTYKLTGEIVKLTGKTEHKGLAIEL